MGLFFASKKPAMSSNSSMHLSNQHGSVKGEINKTEFLQGLHHDLHEHFHGREREVIGKMLEEGLDRNSGSHRHSIDRNEAEQVIKNVKDIYSNHHAEKLRKILEARM